MPRRAALTNTWRRSGMRITECPGWRLSATGSRSRRAAGPAPRAHCAPGPCGSPGNACTRRPGQFLAQQPEERRTGHDDQSVELILPPGVIEPAGYAACKAHRLHAARRIFPLDRVAGRAHAFVASPRALGPEVPIVETGQRITDPAHLLRSSTQGRGIVENGFGLVGDQDSVFAHVNLPCNGACSHVAPGRDGAQWWNVAFTADGRPPRFLLHLQK